MSPRLLQSHYQFYIIISALPPCASIKNIQISHLRMFIVLNLSSSSSSSSFVSSIADPAVRLCRREIQTVLSALGLAQKLSVVKVEKPHHPHFPHSYLLHCQNKLTVKVLLNNSIKKLRDHSDLLKCGNDQEWLKLKTHLKNVFSGQSIFQLTDLFTESATPYAYFRCDFENEATFEGLKRPEAELSFVDVQNWTQNTWWTSPS